MYVDYLLTGAPEDDSALQLKEDLRSLLSKGGFELTKWASNSQKVMEATPVHERAPSLVPNSESENVSGVLKVLGTSWNMCDDVLLLTSGSSITAEEDPMTKRSLISLYSRIFDPMGLLTPFLVTPKLLFQELWARSLDWDDPLDMDITQVWRAWKHELPLVDQIEIPRCLLHGLCLLPKWKSMDLRTAAKKPMVQPSISVLKTRTKPECPI